MCVAINMFCKIKIYIKNNELLSIAKTEDFDYFKKTFIITSYDDQFGFIFHIKEKIQSMKIRKYLRDFIFYTREYCGDDFDENMQQVISDGFIDD